VNETGSCPAPQISACPVCGLPGLVSSVSVCPQCDADLQCFRALELLTPPASREVRDPLPADLSVPSAVAPGPSSIPGPHRALLIIGGGSLGLLLLLVGVQFFLLSRLKARLAVRPALHQRVENPARTRKKEASGRRETPTNRQPVTAEVSPQRPAGLATRYRARAEDSLWSIAARLYGKGDCYPLLLHDNPGVAVNRIGEGLTLKVMSDRDKAARRCRAMIHRDVSGRFWYYFLRPGDSPQSLARRCFGTVAAATRIQQLNPLLRWEAGRRIKLYLP